MINYCAGLFARVFGRSYEESKAMADAGLAEIRTRGVHSYIPM